jgi:NADH-quinone oxidoreductase subunit M
VGVVLAGAYTLRSVRAVAFGPVPDEWSGLRDLSAPEIVALVPLAVGTVVLGVMPSLVANLVAPALAVLSKLMGAS